MNFTVIHDLVFGLFPPFYVRVGPAEALVALGVTGLAVCEWLTWRKHR